MKKDEADQLVEELAHDATLKVQAERIDTYARTDGSGYRVKIVWRVRMTLVRNREQWWSIKQAWSSQEVEELKASRLRTHGSRRRSRRQGSSTNIIKK